MSAHSVHLTNDQEDTIYNALLVGMTATDAYTLAGVKPQVLPLLEEDEGWQIYVSQQVRAHEYSLLQSLNTIIERQQHMGKEGATTWALEHMYPQRYANKSAGEGKTVNIVLNQPQPRANGSEAPLFTDPADDDEVVEIHT